jgi:hypothetical protein
VKDVLSGNDSLLSLMLASFGNMNPQTYVCQCVLEIAPENRTALLMDLQYLIGVSC